MDDFEFAGKIKEIRADKIDGKQRMREFLKLPGYLDRLFDLAIKGAGKPKKPPKTKARTQLPDGFPDEAQQNRAKGFWAQSKRPDLVGDIANQVDGFRDHHVGRGTLAADWPATWGTWMRNALRFNRPGHSGPVGTDHAETKEVWAWRMTTFHNGNTEENLPKGYWRDSWGPRPGEAGCRAPN